MKFGKTKLRADFLKKTALLLEPTTAYCLMKLYKWVNPTTGGTGLVQLPGADPAVLVVVAVSA